MKIVDFIFKLNYVEPQPGEVMQGVKNSLLIIASYFSIPLLFMFRLVYERLNLTETFNFIYIFFSGAFLVLIYYLIVIRYSKIIMRNETYKKAYYFGRYNMVIKIALVISLFAVIVFSMIGIDKLIS